MKRIYFFMILSICGYCMLSCNHNSEEVLPPEQQTNITNKDMHNRLLGRPSRPDIAGYVALYPDIFGASVLIFDSLEQADQTLDKFSEATPEDLRYLYSDLNFNSPIIESNIIYDSVMNEIADYMQIDLTSDTLSTSVLAHFLEEFIQEMHQNHSEFCVIEEQLTNNNDVYYSIKPIGDIDERALCNNKKLFIADGVVFKFSGNYLLTCPFDVYPYVAQYDNLEYLQEYLDNYTINNVNETDLIICELENANNFDASLCNSEMRQPFTDDHSRLFIRTNQNDADKKATVYITMYPYWSWFHTNYRCKMKITNYFRQSQVKAKVVCYFYSMAYGWHSDLYCQLIFNRYCNGLINALDQSIINDKFKSRTFYENKIGNTYLPTRRTYVDIDYLNILLTQNGGEPTGIYLQEEEEQHILN